MPSPQVIISPDATTRELAEAVIEIQRILTKGLGIGDAGDGEELGRNTGGTGTRPPTRRGKSDNILGSLVEITLDATTDLDVPIRCDHGLSLPAPAMRTAGFERGQAVNVRWQIVGARYLSDNAVVAPVGTDHRVLALYNAGQVGEDSVELQFYTDLTLGGAQNGALVVSLFFFPASR